MKESTFQIKTRPSISSVDFKKNENYDFPGDLELKLNSRVVIGRPVNQELDEAMVTLVVQVFTEEDFDTVPFCVEIEINSVFCWIGDYEENKIEILLNENAPAILYSYVRPLLTTLTVEAGLPPLVLPLMNFVNPNK